MDNSIESLLAEADKAYQSKKFEDSAAGFGLALEEQPENKKALFGLGMCYMHMNETKKARDQFLSLFKLDRTHPGAWYGLGLRTARLADLAEEQQGLESEGGPSASIGLVMAHREDALYHFEKAFGYCGFTPLRAEIQEAIHLQLELIGKLEQAKAIAGSA